MSNKGYKIGDIVKHTKFGTYGQVIDIDPNCGVYVFWNNGTSVYYGERNLPLDLICKA